MLVAILMIVCTVAMCASPFDMMPTTNMVTATNDDYDDSDLFEYEQCPPGTSHVFAQLAVGLTIPEVLNTMQSADLGCCPSVSWGSWDTNDNRLYGCCRGFYDNNTQPVFCFNANRQVVGCAASLAQCCGNQICSDNYICCGTQCCPLIDGYEDYSASCSVEYMQGPGGTTVPVLSGCAVPPLAVCQTNTTYAVTCTNPLSFNACPFCQNDTAPCTWPNATTFFPMLCAAAQDCVRVPLILPICANATAGWALSPCTAGVSPVQKPAGCVDPTTFEFAGVCTYAPDDTQVPVVVGPYRINDTCCGPFICSDGMQCCSIYNTSTNVTTYYGCCPSSGTPAIQCCYNDIMDATSTNTLRNFFCGIEGRLNGVDGVACQVDKLREPAWYVMARANRNDTL